MSAQIIIKAILLPASVCLISCSGSKHKAAGHTMPGTWQSQPVAADGDSRDWPSPYPNYDTKAMVAYATSNDARNLYITMETGDELTQMKILKQGMTLSIDTGGKKDPAFHINYPLQNDDENGGIPPLKEISRSEQVHSLERKMEAKINKNAAQANQFSLEGFNNCNGGYMVTQTTACGIKVMARIDEYKELVWEAVIPFKAIFNRDSITAGDAGRPISICFAVKGFKHPESKGSESSGGTGINSSMSSGGMRQGNMGSGGRGGGRGSTDIPYQHLYESTKTWKYFGLAYQH